MSDPALAHYQRRRDESKAHVVARGRQAAFISTLRVISVGLAILGVAGTRWWGLGAVGLVVAVLTAFLFLALVVIHDGVLSRRDRAARALEWAEAGLRRMEDKWAVAPRRDDPVATADHPYADDLDIYGRGSLMQSLDTTATRAGRSLLATWLSSGASPDEIGLRQRCARDLAGRPRFLEDLCVEGAAVAADPPDVEPLLRWTDGAAVLSLRSPALRIAALAFPALTLAIVAFGSPAGESQRSFAIPRALFLVPLVIQLLLAQRNRHPVRAAIVACSEHHDALARFARMFKIVEEARFDAAPLEALRRTLAGPLTSAVPDAVDRTLRSRATSAEVKALGSIVGFVDARRNEVFRLFIGPLLLWDLNCAIALERWRERAGRRMREHIATLARFEALSALGTRAFERPGDAWPVLVEGAAKGGQFAARGLGHPLLPLGQVARNDVTFGRDTGSILLITGSNMSGKSTLLRAIGVNVVLALAGAPVRAESLMLSWLEVHTSMRVRDSLEEGISHFLAELHRLKAVIDAANVASAERPVLFLLDEILHGTNSRERNLGARAIVRHLAEKHACGAVSTHDLALASLAQELGPDRVVNCHFREQIETGADGHEIMTFDYRLRAGVVSSSNALRLMRMVGIELPIPAEPAESERA